MTTYQGFGWLDMTGGRSSVLLRGLQRRRRLPWRNPEGVGPLEQEVQMRGQRQPPDRQRAENARDGHDQRDGADVMDQAALQQQGSRRGHRQEEREIDHDGMLTAETKKIEQARACEQRAGRDYHGGAPSSKHQRDRG